MVGMGLGKATVASIVLLAILFIVPIANSVHAASSNAQYYGGPVMHTTTTYAIYWLPSGDAFEGSLGNDTNYERLTTRFLADLGGSSYFNLASQYHDNQNGAILDESNFGGSYVDTNPYPSNTPSAQDIANEVLQAMDAKGWTGGLTHLFIIFTASGVYQPGAETDYCAYHSWTYTSANQPVVYAYIPDVYSLLGVLGCATLQHLGITPNLDIWADSAINLMSHELFESVTDPLDNAWGTDESEVADLCAWHFGFPINILGADVELNGHYYLVQEEWSNYSNGCALGFGPSPAYTISLGLSPSAGAHAGAFNLTYESEGRTMWTEINTGIASTNIFVDPNSQFTVSSNYTASSLERWCLNSSCESAAYNVGSCSQGSLCIASYPSLVYYDLTSQTNSLSIQGGGTPSVTLTYVTAPPNLGSSDSQTTATVQLRTSPQTVWVERGTTMTTPPSVGSPTERWSTTTDSWSVSSSQVIPNLVYYHQYLVTFAYQVLGGGNGYSSPTVGFYQYSTSGTTVAGQTAWADAGEPYSYSSVLGGSSATERWSANPSSAQGTIASAGTITTGYYHQYMFSLSFGYVGGQGGTLPTITATNWGQTQTVQLTQSSISGFLDAGSAYSMPSILGSQSPLERWYSSSVETSGQISAPTTLSLTYYHQYALAASYGLVGGGNPSPPTISGVSGGVPLTASISQQPGQVWLDANSGYSLPSLLPSLTSTERWATNGATSGVMAGPSTVEMTYYHQFDVPFSYTLVGGGAPPSPQLAGVQFGEPLSSSVASEPEGVWLDAGSQWGVANPLAPTADERWETPTANGTISSADALQLPYFHQFGLTLSYTVAGRGLPYPPSLSGIEFSSSLNVTLTNSTTEYWVDANTVWSVSLSAPPQGERWITDQPTNGTLSSPYSAALSFQHQYYVQVTSTPSLAGSVSTLSGWYDEGAQLQLSAAPAAGYQFGSWVSNSPTPTFGNSNAQTTIIIVNMPLTIMAQFSAVSSSSTSETLTSQTTASTKSTASLSSGGITSAVRTTTTSSSASTSQLIAGVDNSVLAVSIAIVAVAALLGLAMLSRRRAKPS